MNARDYIRELNLQPHPEGGFYRQTYRSVESIPATALPKRFDADRPISTAIYYLLEQGDFSCFHRIKSDECWHFYIGGCLNIHLIQINGEYQTIKLGNNIQSGEVYQYIVPSMTWFAVEPSSETTFALAGCTVAPGFDFADFEMCRKIKMLQLFPEHKSVIERLCRD
jgi:predicted cupin superfamily sugar epimerase